VSPSPPPSPPAYRQAGGEGTGEGQTLQMVEEILNSFFFDNIRKQVGLFKMISETQQ